MKILSVIMAVILVFSLGAAAYATELPDAEARYMGDANGDGTVSADDARLILRSAVGLERLSPESIVYCNSDFDAIVGAADARLALRIAVGLEESQKYAFKIIELDDATCINDGYIAAECQLTGKRIVMNFSAYGHILPENYLCMLEFVCEDCQETIMNDEARHVFVYDEQNNTRKCSRCGFTEILVHTHSFSGGKCSCGITADAAFGEKLEEHIKKTGVRADGYYYIEQYIDPLGHAVIYDEARDFTYVFCGYGVQESGVIIYYDFNFDFENDTVEMLMYTEDALFAYAYGSINPAKVDETADGDAITITEYDSVSELSGFKGEFRMMMEGAVYDSIIWVREICRNADVDYVKEALGEYVRVYNYRW